MDSFLVKLPKYCPVNVYSDLVSLETEKLDVIVNSMFRDRSSPPAKKLLPKIQCLSLPTCFGGI